MLQRSLDFRSIPSCPHFLHLYGHSATRRLTSVHRYLDTVHRLVHLVWLKMTVDLCPRRAGMPE